MRIYKLSYRHLCRTLSRKRVATFWLEVPEELFVARFDGPSLRLISTATHAASWLSRSLLTHNLSSLETNKGWLEIRIKYSKYGGRDRPGDHSLVDPAASEGLLHPRQHLVDHLRLQNRF